MSQRCNLLIILVSAGLLSCQTGSDRMRHDWADTPFYATGVGYVREWTFQERVRAIEAAKQDAARQLEEKIWAHRIDSDQTLAKPVQEGDAIKKVSAFVRGAELLSIENKADGVYIHTRLFLGNHLKAIMGLLPPKEMRPSEGRSMESY